MSDEIKLGQNQYTYRNLVDWAKTPSGISWNEVAGVAVGADGLIMFLLGEIILSLFLIKQVIL